jgi:hypothetical protein
MNIRSNILIAFSLWALVACAPERSTSSTVKLVALGCQLSLPQGYVISSSETGPIRGQFVGAEMNGTQFFEYFPNKNWEEISSSFDPSVRTLRAEQLGEVKHLVVEYRPTTNSNEIWEYNVFSNQSEYLGVPVSANANFEQQFKACAST